MTRFVPLLLLVLTCSVAFAADETARGIWTAYDQPLNTDVTSSFWRGAVATYMDSNPYGKPRSQVPHRDSHPLDATELYFLFVCPLRRSLSEAQSKYVGRNQ